MNIPVEQLAEIVGGVVRGDSNKIIHGAAGFEEATEKDITCADSPKYLKKLEQTGAGVVITPRNVEPCGKTIIQVDHPRVAFAKALRLFFPPAEPRAGISSTASIGDHFVHGEAVSIAPFVVIQNNVALGDRVTLHPHVVIGNQVKIGDDVLIYPHVTILDRCRIGSRVIIHAGTVIGSDGFGFAPNGETYHKIPQSGIVQIDDDVEIGACNTIDRATFGKTWVQRGVKTDNLVQIAHNVTVGENTVIVAQVGIAGSATIGKHAILAGQAGVAGHLTIGDHATIGPQAGVGKSVPEGRTVSGSPEMPHRLWLKVQRIIPRLPELKKKIADMEKQMNRLEKTRGETRQGGE